jgi:hypothetical protein
MLALAVGYYLLAAQIQESQLADTVGPQGLPRIYAYVLGGLSLVLIAQSFRASTSRAPTAHSPEPRAERPEPRAQSPEPSRAHSRILRPAGVIAIGAIYIAVVPWLGYVPSLAALIAASTYYQGGGFNRRVALVAVSGAVAFWLLFVALLGIQHPAGFWPSLF